MASEIIQGILWKFTRMGVTKVENHGKYKYIRFFHFILEQKSITGDFLRTSHKDFKRMKNGCHELNLFFKIFNN